MEAALLGDVDATASALSAWPGENGLDEREHALAASAPDGLALVLLARRFGLPLDALVELDRKACRGARDARTAARGIAVLSDRPVELAELLAWAEQADAAQRNDASSGAHLASIGGAPA